MSPRHECCDYTIIAAVRPTLSLVSSINSADVGQRKSVSQYHEYIKCLIIAPSCPDISFINTEKEGEKCLSLLIMSKLAARSKLQFALLCLMCLSSILQSCVREKMSVSQYHEFCDYLSIAALRPAVAFIGTEKAEET